MRPSLSPRPLFDLGTHGVSATPGAIEAFERLQIRPEELIRRHHHGDWGDLDEEDRAVNEQALASGARIFSAYRVGPAKDTIWVITEALDEESGRRGGTTLLLPSEY